MSVQIIDQINEVEDLEQSEEFVVTDAHRVQFATLEKSLVPVLRTARIAETLISRKRAGAITTVSSKETQVSYPVFIRRVARAIEAVNYCLGDADFCLAFEAIMLEKGRELDLRGVLARLHTACDIVCDHREELAAERAGGAGTSTKKEEESIW